MPKSIAFLKIKKSISSKYLGEKVPKEYQNRYGKRYDSRDINSFSYAVAKSRGIKIEGR